MPTEQRVIASKPRIGAKPTIGGGATAAVQEAPPAGTSRKKLVLLLVALLVVGGGAGYWFLVGPGAGASEEVVEKAPEPGEVVQIEPISINLADGHYLRLGLGLQMAKEVSSYGDPKTAPALDHAIALFSGRPMAEVVSSEGREALKAELLTLLETSYEGDVIGVYFTEYVTQ